jgi:hypothetical protein
VLVTAGWPAAPASARGLRKYKTAYYIVHSDMPEEDVREATVRLTAMFREFRGRSKGFSGGIKTRMPFKLYGDRVKYLGDGAPPGSGGYFNPETRELAALAILGNNHFLWHTVQHEAFHQFAHFVLSKHLPVWANEGTAEYFGKSLWAGDDYITGVVSPFDRLNIVDMIDDGAMMSFERMMAMDLREWNRNIDIRNYMQAWSMVHFFVHGQDGKYRKAYDKFLSDMDKGKQWRASFAKRFGVGMKTLEDEYQQWWKSLPANCSDKDIEATVATLTAFLGRAHVEGQAFETAEAFFTTARAGELKYPKKQWLPPRLLAEALAPSTLFNKQLKALPIVKKIPSGRKRIVEINRYLLATEGEGEGIQIETLGEWTIQVVRSVPTLVLTRPDGTEYVGSFEVKRRAVEDVDVEISRPDDAPLATKRRVGKPKKANVSQDADKPAADTEEKKPTPEP